MAMNDIPHLDTFGYQGILEDVGFIFQHKEYLVFKFQGKLEAHFFTSLGGKSP